MTREERALVLLKELSVIKAQAGAVVVDGRYDAAWVAAWALVKPLLADDERAKRLEGPQL